MFYIFCNIPVVESFILDTNKTKSIHHRSRGADVAFTTVCVYSACRVL